MDQHAKAGRAIVIGGASGFWGDSQIAVPQLLQEPELGYLVFDYLAETTMAILQRARLRAPALGYATDFVTAALKPNLKALKERGVRLVSNAGGLNPAGCRDAILALAREQGLDLKVAIVSGDDVLALRERFLPWPGEEADATLPQLMSANAYLGALPIAQALAGGADIVVTGRCVDSAAILGVAIHEFGWSMQDYDHLAQASLAGHLLECGAQATGGLFTDWERVPDWANIGYPLVRMTADSVFELYQPSDAGGLVTRQTVGEQMLYEIGDPRAYALPDVVCDFSGVQIKELPGFEACGGRVRVSGARGRAPGDCYKVTATYQQGYQIALMMAIRGQRALEKAERTAQALLTRSRSLMAKAGHADYSDTLVELLGAESMYGPHRRVRESREVVLRIAAQHGDKHALAFLQKEAASAGTSMGPGTRSHFGGRSDIQSVIRTASFLLPKQDAAVQWQMSGDPAVPLDVSASGTPVGTAVLASPVHRGHVEGELRQDTRRTVRIPLWRPGGRPQWRQRQRRQYRADGARSGLAVCRWRAGNGRASARLLCASDRRTGAALRTARHRRLQLRAGEGTGGRGLLQPALRPTGQMLRADAAGHGNRLPRGLAPCRSGGHTLTGQAAF